MTASIEGLGVTECCMFTRGRDDGEEDDDDDGDDDPDEEDDEPVLGQFK